MENRSERTVMAEELITMEDMETIFEVTDALGIHRDRKSVV